MIKKAMQHSILTKFIAMVCLSSMITNCGTNSGSSLVLKKADGGGGSDVATSEKASMAALETVPYQLFRLQNYLVGIVGSLDNQDPVLNCPFSKLPLKATVGEDKKNDLARDFDWSGCKYSVVDESTPAKNEIKYLMRGSESLKWSCGGATPSLELVSGPLYIDKKINDKSVQSNQLNRSLKLKFSEAQAVGANKKQLMIPMIYNVSLSKFNQATVDKSKTQANKTEFEMTVTGKLMLESDDVLDHDDLCHGLLKNKSVKIIGLSQDTNVKTSKSNTVSATKTNIELKPNSDIYMTPDKVCGNKLKIDFDWKLVGQNSVKKLKVDEHGISTDLNMKPTPSECVETDFQLPGSF